MAAYGLVMESAKSLQIIGAGSLCEALVRGWMKSDYLRPEEITIVHRSPERALRLQREWPSLHTVTSVQRELFAIIAVRPEEVREVCRALSDKRVGSVVSLAAGISVRQLEDWLSPGTAVARAMPNLPVSVGEGQTALSFNVCCTPEDVSRVRLLFGAVGVAVDIDESSFDAFTSVCGCGPGYIFEVAAALIAASEEQGMPHEASVRLVLSLIAGTGKLLTASGSSLSDLQEAILLPGGMTVEGVSVLRRSGLAKIVSDAVKAASARGQQLRSNG